MVVGVTKAAQLAGVSRTTLWRKARSGALSTTVGRNGDRRIDTAELTRVFGTLQPESPPLQRFTQPTAPPETVARLQAQVAELERILADVRRELDAERSERRALQARLLELTDRFVRLLPSPDVQADRTPRPARSPRAPRPRRPSPPPTPTLSGLLSGVASWLSGDGRR